VDILDLSFFLRYILMSLLGSLLTSIDQSGAVISEDSWYISALIPSGLRGLFNLNVFIYVLLFRRTLGHSLAVGNLSASLSSRDKLLIISSAVSCQAIVIDSIAFLTVDMMLPLFSLLVTILYVVVLYVLYYGFLFTFFSMYFFHVFSLELRITALYFFSEDILCPLSDFEVESFFQPSSTDISIFSFLWDQKSSRLSLVICLHIFLGLSYKLWLFSSWILSWLPSDFPRDSMISFLSILRIACPSLLFADCMTVLSILLVAC